jgi:hypothetical protein
MLDPIPDTLTQLDTSPDHNMEKRTVQYWVGKIPDRLINLRGRFDNLLQITPPSMSLGNMPPTSTELHQRAAEFAKTSEQLRLISHIFYCAAGVKEMLELTPKEYFVSVFCFFSFMFTLTSTDQMLLHGIESVRSMPTLHG